jgi:hypothetical protein
LNAGLEDVRQAENEGDRQGAGDDESTGLATVRDPPRPFATDGSRVTDDAMEAALVRAMLDGRVEVAEVLARQLRTRQLERAGNVVALDDERTRRGR